MLFLDSFLPYNDLRTALATAEMLDVFVHIRVFLACHTLLLWVRFVLSARERPLASSMNETPAYFTLKDLNSSASANINSAISPSPAVLHSAASTSPTRQCTQIYIFLLCSSLVCSYVSITLFLCAFWSITSETSHENAKFRIKIL